MSSPDTPLLSAKMAVLKELWDAEINGQIGTPKERLQALDAKAARARQTERFRRLSVQKQSTVWRRAALGEDLVTLLKEFGQ